MFCLPCALCLCALCVPWYVTRAAVLAVTLSDLSKRTTKINPKSINSSVFSNNRSTATNKKTGTGLEEQFGAVSPSLCTVRQPKVSLFDLSFSEWEVREGNWFSLIQTIDLPALCG